MDKLKIMKLTDTAITPTRGTPVAAGLDLYADSAMANKDVTVWDDVITIKPHAQAKINTGIAAAIPSGYVGLLFNRSGIAIKQNLRLANCVGVIDEDYRGPIIAAFQSDSDEEQKIKIGDRVAQLVLVPCIYPDVEIVDELDNTIRGTGGFGSTGTR